MDLDLAGKTAFVSGSSVGIGRATAQLLAHEGVHVAVHGRNPERTEATVDAITAAGGQAFALLGDLTDPDAVARITADALRRLGRIDILVNNIGGTESTGPTAVVGWFEVQPEQWAGAMEQNLIAAVRLIHAFVPAMREAGWGRVVNVASAAAASAPALVPEYAAAKAGLANVSVGLAKALARTGVTVNTVSPGPIKTDMLDRSLNKFGEMHGWPEDMDERERLFMDLNIYPCITKRYGRAEEVAALIGFLASPLAAFVTGANYRIDGGQVPTVN